MRKESILLIPTFNDNRIVVFKIIKMIKKTHSIFIMLSFAVIVQISAQIEAVTKDGKPVILYDDGSWEYYNENPLQSSQETIIDSTLNSNGELTELYYTTSPRLNRYFNDNKSKIRGKSKCSIVNGKGKLFFQWELSLPDAHRYFGTMKGGLKVTLDTQGPENLEVLLTEEIAIDIIEKYNYSVLKAACFLTPEQLDVLLKYPVQSIEVGWKKDPEKYIVNDSHFFRSNFISLLKK